MFRVVSESCQINFVRCYANCPDPGDVLILIIEATLRYGVSIRSSNLEICFLSLGFLIRPSCPGFRLSPLQSIYSPSFSGLCDMFNVECNLKDNPSAQLAFWRLEIMFTETFGLEASARSMDAKYNTPIYNLHSRQRNFQSLWHNPSLFATVVFYFYVQCKFSESS